MLNDDLLASLSNVQKSCAVWSDSYEFNEKVHGACPYGCGRSCSGCEYSCQNTCSSKNSGGGCFITTATCRAFGKPDDCHELTVLRRFRDEFMKPDGLMRAEVDEYYEIAPRICEAIDKSENADSEYTSIWENWLNDAVSAVDKGENQKAYRIYKDMVLSLKEKWLRAA